MTQLEKFRNSCLSDPHLNALWENLSQAAQLFYNELLEKGARARESRAATQGETIRYETFKREFENAKKRFKDETRTLQIRVPDLDPVEICQINR
jgi:hypothetical protein